MYKGISASVLSPTDSIAASPWLRSAGIVVAGSLLLTVCSRVSVPLWFSPVPLSLQPFGVLLLGLLLAPGMAAATLVAYLAEGAAGLPVFAPTLAPLSGLAHLFGPTGGYLLAYLLAGVLISFIWRQTGRNFAMGLVSAAVGDLLILTCGTLWLAIESHTPLQSVLSASILAFLPGDALKIAAAAGIATGWQRFRRQDQ